MWLGPMLTFLPILLTNASTAREESTVSSTLITDPQTSASGSLEALNTSYAAMSSFVSSSKPATYMSPTSNSERVSSTKIAGLRTTNKTESSSFLSSVIETKTSPSLSKDQEYSVTFTAEISVSSNTLIPSITLLSANYLPSSSERIFKITSTTAVQKAKQDRSSVDGTSILHIQLNSTTITSSTGVEQVGSVFLTPSPPIVSQTHVALSSSSLNTTVTRFNNSTYLTVPQQKTSGSVLSKHSHTSKIIGKLQVLRSTGIFFAGSQTTRVEESRSTPTSLKLTLPSSYMKNSLFSSSTVTLDITIMIRPSVSLLSPQIVMTNSTKETQMSHSMMSSQELSTSFDRTTKMISSSDSAVRIKAYSTSLFSRTTTDRTMTAATPTSSVPKLKEQVFLVTMKITSEEFKEEYDTSIRALHKKGKEIVNQFDRIFESMPEYVYTEFQRLFRNHFGCEVVIHTESSHVKTVSVEDIQKILDGVKKAEGGFGNFSVDDIHIVEKDPDVKWGQENDKETWARLPIIVISILGGVCLVLLVLVISHCIQKRHYSHSLADSNEIQDYSPNLHLKSNDDNAYKDIDEERVPMTTFKQTDIF